MAGQVAGWIYSASGVSFTLEEDSKGQTWLVTGTGERLREMTRQEFAELEASRETSVRYPALDAMLTKEALENMRSKQ